MKPPAFYEVQRVTQIWIWIVVAAIDLYFLYAFVQQIFLRMPFGEKPVPDAVLYFILFILILVSTILATVRLETAIDSSGISYRFLPILCSFRNISFDELEQAYLREYKPIREYGGWGIRVGLFG